MTANNPPFEFFFQMEAREPHPSQERQFPDGMRLDIAGGEPVACEVTLPYPAPGIGTLTGVCQFCRRSFSIPAHGRADDPCWLRLGCRILSRA